MTSASTRGSGRRGRQYIRNGHIVGECLDVSSYETKEKSTREGGPICDSRVDVKGRRGGLRKKHQQR